MFKQTCQNIEFCDKHQLKHNHSTKHTHNEKKNNSHTLPKEINLASSEGSNSRKILRDRRGRSTSPHRETHHVKSEADTRFRCEPDVDPRHEGVGINAGR